MAEKKKILILGKTGSGKSHLAKSLLKKYDRYIVFDTMDEYTDGVIVESLGELAALWRKCHTGNFRIIYRPRRPADEIETIAKLVYDCENLTFLCEEIDLFGSAYKISDEMSDILRRGRHKEITFIGVTQRPFGINRLVTSQSKEIYVFATNEPRDREYLKQLLATSQITEQDVVDRLDELKQYEYVLWKDGRQKLEIGKA